MKRVIQIAIISISLTPTTAFAKPFEGSTLDWYRFGFFLIALRFWWVLLVGLSVYLTIFIVSQRRRGNRSLKAYIRSILYSGISILGTYWVGYTVMFLFFLLLAA